MTSVIRGFTVLLATLPATGLVLAGCTVPGQKPDPVATRTDRPAAGDTLRRAVIGRSVEGRPLEVIELGEGPDVVLFLGAIHGDEPAGTPLLERLAEELIGRPDRLSGRRVLIIPVANPDGLDHATRFNANGVDLNRNFPTGNRTATLRHGVRSISEPESLALHDLIVAQAPARIVTIHQPLACIDYDGPAEDLARAMARHVTLPIRRLGARPGSLGSFAGLEQQIPVITLELPAGVEALDAEILWGQFGAMLLAAVTFPE